MPTGGCDEDVKRRYETAVVLAVIVHYEAVECCSRHSDEGVEGQEEPVMGLVERERCLGCRGHGFVFLWRVS